MNKRLLAILAVGLLVEPVASHAAAIPFYQVVNPSPSTFVNSGGATREIFFQVVNNVTITELGVLLDPASSTTSYSWRIYQSGLTRAFGTQVLNTSVAFVDAGLDTYDTSVNVGLVAGGYYILQLLTPVATNMGFPLESAQGLPFLTSDSNFTVLDGGANGQVVQNGWLNGILPPFSVTTLTARPVPEPGTLILLGLGLAGLSFARRYRRN